MPRSFDSALKQYNLKQSPKPRKNKGQSKASNQHIYIDPVTGQEVEKGFRDAIHFDSKLEATVWRFLCQHFNPFHIHRQKVIEYAYDTQNDIRLTWKPDFYIESIDTYIEVKGGWINQEKCKAEKSLFIWQLTLARVQGLNVKVVSDNDFSIGNVQVSNYVQTTKELKSWLLLG